MRGTIEFDAEFLMELLNSIDDPVFVKDRHHRWIFLNNAACALWRCPRESLIGKSDYDLFPKEEADIYWAKDDAVIRSARPDLNEELQTIDGRVHVIATKKSVLTAARSGRKFIVATIRDITEQKRVEEALKSSEHRYRQLYENSLDGIVSVDMEGRFIECNLAYRKMLGYTIDELHSFTYRDVTPERWHQWESALVEEKVFKRGYSGLYEKEYRRKDGSVFPVEMSVFLMLGRDGKPEGMWGIVRDITERKEGETAVRESEARMQSIFRAAPIGIGVVKDRVIISVNDPLCRMVGYTKEELMGRSARLLYPHDEDYEYVGREKYAQIRERGIGTVETRWKRGDGQTIDILLSSTPIDRTDPSSEVTFTALDITERKRAEEDLRRSELRLSVFNRIAKVFLTSPREQMYRDVLKVVCELFHSKAGYFGRITESGDFLCLSMMGEVRGKRSDEHKNVIFPRMGWEGPWGRSLIERRSICQNAPFKLPEGHPPFSSSMAVPIVHGAELVGQFVAADKPGGYTDEDVGLLESIASQMAPVLKARIEEQRHEEALRESREKYLNIFEESPIGIAFFDKEGRIVDINRACLEIFGVSRKERMQRFGLFDDPVFSDGRKDLLKKGNRLHYEAEFDTDRMRDMGLLETSKSGSLFLEILIAPVSYVSERKLFGYLLQVIDITDRKRGEGERKKLEEQLNQAQKMEAIGQLAGGVAHDFNNLLTAIIGYSEMLSADPNLGGDSRNDVDEIRKSAARAASLTQQLLAFSRKQVIQPKIIDMNALIAQMEEMLRRLIGEHITLLTPLDPGIAPIKADPGQIEQVILNLSVNARDAMPEGGTLAISTRNAVVEGEWDSAH